ncbi:MAG: hypothetical protein CMK06_11895, partial [Ponticaulis sp.]|nr:hypothetical protein [Ponticaulis sp.]
DDGSFVIMWNSSTDTTDNSGYSVKAKFFNYDGSSRDFSEDSITTLSTAALLRNDSDGDGDTLSVTAVNGTSANGATVTLNGDGTISYDPTGSSTIQALNDGQTLDDTFTYTVSDGNGGTTTGTVTITVNGADESGSTKMAMTSTAETETESSSASALVLDSGMVKTGALTFADVVLQNGEWRLLPDDYGTYPTLTVNGAPSPGRLIAPEIEGLSDLLPSSDAEDVFFSPDALIQDELSPAIGKDLAGTGLTVKATASLEDLDLSDLLSADATGALSEHADIPELLNTLLGPGAQSAGSVDFRALTGPAADHSADFAMDHALNPGLTPMTFNPLLQDLDEFAELPA